MMSRGGGCCGGHAHGGHGSEGHDHTEEGKDGSGRTDNQVEMVYDPECGMHVNPEAAIKQNVDGKAYYFCSEECRGNYVRKHF